MNYAQIRQYDIANGVGIRTTLFVSGCTFNCKNCFNKEYQNFNYGKVWDDFIEDYFINLANENVIDGVSILGGEPLMQDDDLYNLLVRLNNEVCKPIWLWTGYNFTEIPDDKHKILPLIDVLIDGRFIKEKAHHSLRFRGSMNQRIIDVKKTLKNGNIELLNF